MRIGIYNPYITSKGGGEKVSLAVAQLLSRKHEVEVIVSEDKDIDIETLAEYFNFDLTRVKLINLGRKQTIANRIISKLPLIPGGVKHTIYTFLDYRTIKSRGYDVFFNNQYHSSMPNPSKTGVYMCMFPHRLGLVKHKTLNPIRFLYYILLELLNYTLFGSYKAAVESYNVITANSKFTQKYITEYWDVSSEILYPICENMGGVKLRKKEKVILNVGRFFARLEDNHHKRQDFLLETFLEMKDLHAEGWELHFVGSVAQDLDSLKYVLDLIKDSSGAPVYFHLDASFSELKALYQKSQIYWHATGYDSDAEVYPETQEHFGITTVEAMSTGSIPVVIVSAGQKETVENVVNGFRWNNQHELINYTRKAIGIDEETKDSIRRSAQDTSKIYGSSGFEKRLRSILTKHNVMNDIL